MNVFAGCFCWCFWGFVWVFYLVDALVSGSVYVRCIRLGERPEDVTVFLFWLLCSFVFFFSFKANAVSAHLFHELMTSHILRCSQPSHQPPETLAASFVNHSSLTNFASQVVFYLLFLSFSPLT